MIDNLALNMVIYNEEERIKESFPKFRKIFGEIVIGVQKSDDNSFEIASQFADTIIEDEHLRFPEPTRPVVEYYTKSDWVLWIDADETISEAFHAELESLINQTEFDGYYTPREHKVNGELIEANPVEYEKYQLGKKGTFVHTSELHTPIRPHKDCKVKQLGIICIEHYKTEQEVETDRSNYKYFVDNTPELVNEDWLEQVGRKYNAS
jgi:hypothetical protein